MAVGESISVSLVIDRSTTDGAEVAVGPTEGDPIFNLVGS